ncbi:MAG: GFA family protein [Myxococcales bacterium]|nr:GFA family protein [Myxococcales bacterium]
MQTTHPTAHTGSCHCGAVRFTVEVDASHATRCNCSVCMKIAGTTAIVRPAAFTLHSDPAALAEYVCLSGVGRRYFCPRCGVHCFARGHLEQLGGDYVSVAINTLDDVDMCDVQVVHWDGRNNNWAAGPRATPWPLTPRA